MRTYETKVIEKFKRELYHQKIIADLEVEMIVNCKSIKDIIKQTIEINQTIPKNKRVKREVINFFCERLLKTHDSRYTEEEIKRIEIHLQQQKRIIDTKIDIIKCAYTLYDIREEIKFYTSEVAPILFSGVWGSIEEQIIESISKDLETLTDKITG